MRLTDVVYIVPLYFGLVVGVWGTGIAFYFGETGSFQYGEVPSPETLSELPQTTVKSFPNPEDSWNATDLLEAGQSFDYFVTTRKDINLSFEVIRGFLGGFLVLGKAQSQGAVKTGSITIISGGPDYYEDRFMVDKKSGAPKASTYTASFWGAGPCSPPKSYFYGRSLAMGNKWNVSIQGDETVEILEDGHLLGSECFVGQIGGARLLLCKEIPLIAKYEGDWCTMGGRIAYTLNKFKQGEDQQP